MRQWFTMKKDEEKTAEIIIYDEIGKSWWGEDTVSAKQFLEDLTGLGEVDNINLRINSPGGDVFDSVAIHNALKNHGAKITAYVDGIAASGASYIAMAASKVVMPSNSFMLIHGASGFAMGGADDMRAQADDLDRIDKSLTATYVARSKSTTAKVKALMKEDRLMDADEAKVWGFADEVSKPVKMAANFSLRLLPRMAADKFRAEAGDQNDPPLPPDQQPPPPPAPAPKPGEQPEQKPPPPFPPPPPPPQQSADIVNLDAAKQQGIEEHRIYVSSVTDLCILARTPERVGAYVRANTPVDQVRKELLDLAAAEPLVMPHHPMMPTAQSTNSATMWTKITDKLNARNTK